MMVKFTLFTNANTKNLLMKHWPFLKYVMIYRPNLDDLQTRKRQLKK